MDVLVWTYSLISVVLVSLVSLIGVFVLVLRRKKLDAILLFLVSFSVGGLFGDAFFHLMPESFEIFKGNEIALSCFILLGILVFFVVEKVVRWRHCHISNQEHQKCHPIAWMNLVGDGVHNFIDGMVIAASFALSFPLGIATTIAVLLHEIPQEIGDFGVLLHSGLSVKRALLFNLLSALFAILGAIFVLIVGQGGKGFSNAMIPLAIGGFVYIAGTDLMPELHHDSGFKNSLIQFFAILLGILIMFALLFLE